MDNSNNVTGNGFRFLGKILQQTEDEINEKLSFSQKSESRIDGHDHNANDLQDLSATLKDNEELYEAQGNTKSSVKDRIVKFFKDFFSKDLPIQDLMGGIQNSRKSSFLDLIINLLNKILIQKKYTDLQEMINQEIYKLQLELSEETDYELRKILELRILMLAVLKSSILFAHENPLLLDFLIGNVILANLKEVELEATIDQKSELTSHNLSLYLEKTLCSTKIENLRSQQNPSLYTQKIHLSNESLNHKNTLDSTYSKTNDKINKFENHNNSLSMHISHQDHKQPIKILQAISLILIVVAIVRQHYIKNIGSCTQKIKVIQEKEHKTFTREEVPEYIKTSSLAMIIPYLLGSIIFTLILREERNNQKDKIEAQEKTTHFRDLTRRESSEVSR